MLQGAITAIVTPFDERGNIDEKALRKLVSFQIEGGISGIVPCGTTGESPTLTHEEHNQAIDIVIDEARGRVPVIAGTGSNSTDEAIRLTRHALKSGAHSSLQVAPYYNKPTQKGLYEHFIAIAEAVDLPMIIYNIPGRTGINIETDTLMKLADHKNIIGVKEASGNIPQMMDVLSRRPKSLPC
jgi:4-hydroxy-tetrahydrodipicolinate synthase